MATSAESTPSVNGRRAQAWSGDPDPEANPNPKTDSSRESELDPDDDDTGEFPPVTDLDDDDHEQTD
jgi:hypothetical protein